MLLKFIKRMLIGYAILLLIGLVGLHFAEPYILFPGGWAREKPKRPEVKESDEFYYRYLDDQKSKYVEAVFLKNPNAEKAGLLVFAHGNAMLIDDWIDILRIYHEFGFHVLLVEFRSYGRSSGAPNADQIVDDFAYFYDEVIKHPAVDANNVVFHGWSIGGGILSELANTKIPDKIILNSTFSSLKAVIQDKAFLPDFLITTNLRPIESLREFLGPVQINHGKDDDLIPVKHAHALQKALKFAELQLYSGGHNDAPKEWEEYWRNVGEFLQRK